MENASSKRPVHVGHNIQKFRLIRGISQAGLAHMIEDRTGRPISQQLISDIEDREAVDDEELLKQIAEILEVTPEALRNLDFDAAINVIGNTFTNNDHAYQQFATTIHNQHTFNPLKEFVDLFKEKEQKLKDENENLKKEIEELKKGKKGKK